MTRLDQEDDWTEPHLDEDFTLEGHTANVIHSAMMHLLLDHT